MTQRFASVRLEVSVNGEVRCVGGVGDFGVLSAIVGWVRRHPDRIHPDVRSDSEFDEAEMLKERIDVQFGGLDSRTDRHVHWLAECLKPGDVVSIRILAEGEYDDPQEGPPVRQ